jgi:hypothetical protein
MMPTAGHHFLKEDRGLLRDWMAIAAIRAAANRKDAIDARRLTVTADIGSGDGPHAEILRPQHQVDESVLVEDGIEGIKPLMQDAT